MLNWRGFFIALQFGVNRSQLLFGQTSEWQHYQTMGNLSVSFFAYYPILNRLNFFGYWSRINHLFTKHNLIL